MRKRDILSGTVITMFLVAGSAVAQHDHRPGGSEQVEVLTGDGPVTIPFELVNNHVIIPITIDGSTFNVILDTGMPMPGLMLFGTERVNRLGLEFGTEKAMIGGAGGEGHTAADMARGVTIDVEGVRISDAMVIVMPPIAHFTTYHEGVIGASLFNNFVVDINYDKGRIVLHDAKSYTAAPGATSVPVTFIHNVPYVDVNVTTADGNKVPLNLVVDLGASHAVSLNVDSTNAIEVPEKAIRTVIGRGVSGEVNGKVGRIRGLELGGITLNDVVATFPVSDHQHPGGMDSKNGNLGDGVLKRFNVTFDYSRKRMLLVKNARFPAPFEWDMSGMRLGPGDGALRIESIIPGSPAQQAGLESDDVITHVNGRAVSAGDMVELKELMKQEGKVIDLAATRGGKSIEVKFTLRRLV